MSKKSTASLVRQLDEFTAQLADSVTLDSGRSRKQLRGLIIQLIDQLREIEARLDPIHQPVNFFDPSDPNVIGRFIGIALVAQPKIPLKDIDKFYGSGVYALYYCGPFLQYAPICATETPLYVGKADPEYGAAATPCQQGTRLHNRLREHARSIRKADNLQLEDFNCRYLVVQSGWQEAAESYLIDVFSPIWNNEVKLVYGIGKHGDSATTRANRRSPWDTMHPGRAWAWSAPEITDQVTGETLGNMLQEHFSNVPPFTDTANLLERFFQSLQQTALQ
jgi:hypothetical protein